MLVLLLLVHLLLVATHVRYVRSAFSKAYSLLRVLSSVNVSEQLARPTNCNSKAIVT
jgi:hypothetical protein